MQTAGIRLRLRSGREVRIFCRFECKLADESGLHQVWLCKGASGIKPCVECMNVVCKTWHKENNVPDTHFLKPFNKLYRCSELVLHTKETIHVIVDDLQQQEPLITNDAFKAKETRVGFTHSRYSLLLEPSLRDIVDPSDHNTFDWPHSVLQGVFKVHVAAMMRVFHPIVKYKTLHEYMQLWTWPRRLEGRAATGKEAMNAKRAASSWEADSFKLQCSEALSMYGVLAHWVANVLLPMNLFNDACNAYLLLADLIDLLVGTARGIVTPEMLSTAVTAYLEAFAAAHGTDRMTPKFHHMLHFARVLAKLGFLPNCIALERKHKSVMQFANNLDNTSAGYASSVLRDVTCKSLYVLEHGVHLDSGIGLMNPRAPPTKLLAWLNETFEPGTNYTYSDRARYSQFEVCDKGDFVAVRSGDRWVLGQVWFHVCVVDACITGVSVLQLVQWNEHSSVWRDVGASDIIALDDIKAVFIYSKSGDEVTVIHPLHVR